MAVDSGLFPVY